MEDDPAGGAIFRDPLARAEYFGAMETGAPFGDFPGDAGVGVRGGAQDHVAIVCARAAAAGSSAPRWCWNSANSSQVATPM